MPMANTCLGAGTGLRSTAWTNGPVPLLTVDAKSAKAAQFLYRLIGSGPNCPPEIAATSAISSPRTTTARPSLLAIFTGLFLTDWALEVAAQVGEQRRRAG